MFLYFSVGYDVGFVCFKLDNLLPWIGICLVLGKIFGKRKERCAMPVAVKDWVKRQQIWRFYLLFVLFYGCVKIPEKILCLLLPSGNQFPRR
jgi:hypothetical protein